MPSPLSEKLGLSPNDFIALKKPGLELSLMKASEMQVKKEQLFLESLYDNPLRPLDFGTSLIVNGDAASTFEIGLHIGATALQKSQWCCVVDSSSKVCPLALYEAAASSSRFVFIHSFNENRFLSVLNHLVSSIRVVVANVPCAINASAYARIMSRVRETNCILVLLDPQNLCQANGDRRIKATTKSFGGLDFGDGVLTSRDMNIAEFEHGMKLVSNG